MSIAFDARSARTNLEARRLPGPASVAPDIRETARDAQASAFDRTRMSSRALNAIELLWGRDAKRADLLKPDAYERLRRARGIGQQSLAQIERAVVAWGFEGIGGHEAFDAPRRKAWTHRNRLEGVMRQLGPKQMLLLLGELCAERVASSQQKVSRRSSRLRRARCERAITYYQTCCDYFRACAAAAPVIPDL